MSASHRQARGTSQEPWVLDLPFDPAAPFANGTLGCLMDTGAAGTPDASTYRHLVSAENYAGNEGQGPVNINTAGGLNPVANPGSNLGSGYFWWTQIGMQDLCLIRPYLVLYSSSSHTALGSAAAAAGISAKMSFWTTREIGRKMPNRPLEYAAEFIGQVTVTNAATRVNSATMQIPTGAQFCDAATVVIDKSISPGIRVKGSGIGGTGAGTGGALELLFDQQGGTGLLIRVSDLTSSAGCGWLRSHI